MPTTDNDEIKFVYGSPAMIAGKGKRASIVVGDIHIGMESKLRRLGIRLYDTAASMARDILRMASEFSISRAILLGDIKDQVLRPESSERFAISNFFNILSPLDVTVVRGNHDAYLSDMLSVPIVDELTVGRFSFTHGNSWPSEKAMQSQYLITAHNHAALSIKDLNGALYSRKAWVIAEINPEEASRRYRRFNKSIKLIIMPAFNDLILGHPVNEGESRGLGPLLQKMVFETETASVYSLEGQYFGRISELRKKQ
ncbi:MAG: metallophosphoesterase [Candidatus Marsarchaeota archaeon]|nr:metallophosphoesterase [Candidatus Marsarchaeota archaeon]MCL5430889.1 metallophosphoesterase [Candidatus Marsarchaeota archaeon]